MLTLLLVVSASAACPAAGSDVVASLDDAEDAFEGLDLDTFRTASDRVTAEIACLTETLSRGTIARVHRVQGLRAFVDDDLEGAEAAFASARAIAPSYRFPDALVPPGHPVRERYSLQDPLSGGHAHVPPPSDGQIEVDGVVGAELPRTRPSVVQLARIDGSVPASMYFRPGDSLFEYDTEEPGAVGVDPVPPPVAREAHTSVPLAVAGGVLLAAGVGTYVAASGTRRAYLDSTDVDEIESLRSRTNALAITSYVAGGTGLALGVGAVVVGKW